MPVIAVTLPHDIDPGPVLLEITTGVASALCLPADAVHAYALAAQAAYTGRDNVRPWPTALLMGGRRAPAATANASRAAETALAKACDVPTEAVWVQWLIRESEPQ